MPRRSLLPYIAVALIGLLLLAGCERSAPELTPPTPTASGLTLIPPPTQAATGVATSAATRAVITPSGTVVAATPTRLAQANPTATSTPTAIPATPTPTATPPPQAFPYIVQPGDTLASIAAKFNTTVDVLKALNNLQSDQIKPGDNLIIPGAPPQAQATATTAPPTQPPSGTTSTGPRTIRYVVKPGDRLFRIGLRYGVSWTVIARANGIVNPNLIQPGQVLVIPLSGSADSSSGRTYTVQAGDTLSGIALRFNTSVQAIMLANNLRSTIIIPGQALRIP